MTDDTKWLESIRDNPKTKDCCKNPENLEDRDNPRPDLRLKVCRVCNNRHMKLDAKGAKLTTKLEPVA